MPTADRFGAHQTFKTGVQWAPTDYKEIDQTPYLEYLEKNGPMMKTDEIVLASHEDAEMTLSAMKDILKQYEQVTFADLLELVGLSSTFSDNKIGWVNLINIQIKPVNNGYILDLPQPKAL